MGLVWGLCIWIGPCFGTNKWIISRKLYGNTNRITQLLKKFDKFLKKPKTVLYFIKFLLAFPYIVISYFELFAL